MIGGIVIEVADVRGRPEVVFVDCRGTGCERRSTCAVYLERNGHSERIEVGDGLWWQGRQALWTPRRGQSTHHDDGTPKGKAGVDYDISVPRVGYSGINHPSRT